jgi:hypothetical protein
MATYSSYKKIKGENILDNTIQDADLASSALSSWNVKWFHGQPCECSTGCCCAWTVPTGVARMYIEAWGSGGTGHGACLCSRCHHFRGAGGGYYNSKMISTTPGCSYTVCAGGVYRCRTRECCGCNGCSSYVTGYNLSGFCAIGGHGGIADTAWSTGCFSTWTCCLGPTSNGGDFGMGNHQGAPDNMGLGICRCWCARSQPTSAPFIGTVVRQGLNCCWMRCGCWTVPYGHGGQGAMTTGCGSGCCGQSGTGGPGLVKITYV